LSLIKDEQAAAANSGSSVVVQTNVAASVQSSASKHNYGRKSNACHYRERYRNEKHGNGCARARALAHLNGLTAGMVDWFAFGVHGSTPPLCLFARALPSRLKLLAVRLGVLRTGIGSVFATSGRFAGHVAGLKWKVPGSFSPGLFLLGSLLLPMKTPLRLGGQRP
jgi:hypothetical protein